MARGCKSETKASSEAGLRICFLVANNIAKWAGGGKARNAKLTPEQRSELARELNRIRWSKPRVAQVDSAAAKKLQDEARP